MNTSNRPNWIVTGCMLVCVVLMALLCWLATLGYMTTVRAAGL